MWFLCDMMGKIKLKETSTNNGTYLRWLHGVKQEGTMAANLGFEYDSETELYICKLSVITYYSWRLFGELIEDR